MCGEVSLLLQKKFGALTNKLPEYPEVFFASAVFPPDQTNATLVAFRQRLGSYLCSLQKARVYGHFGYECDPEVCINHLDQREQATGRKPVNGIEIFDVACIQRMITQAVSVLQQQYAGAGQPIDSEVIRIYMLGIATVGEVKGVVEQFHYLRIAQLPG